MTAITEINRNGSKTARGLVSIQSRYNQILDDTSSTGQKLIDFYEENNIQLYDQEGQLRSLWETLNDVAAIWDTLSDNEQKYFLNIQAGANQSIQLGALMQNFQTAIDATNTALNSSGSAMKENEAYMESLEAQTNLLAADFQTLANDIITKDLISSILNLGDKLLKLADSDIGQVITKMVLLGGIVGAGSALVRASGVFDAIRTSVTGLVRVMQGATVTATEMSAAMTMGLSLAVMAVVGLVEATKALEQSLDPMNRIAEASTRIAENQSKLAENEEVLALIDRFQELRKQTELTEAEEQELLQIRSDLADKTNGLIPANDDFAISLDKSTEAVKAAYLAEQYALRSDIWTDVIATRRDYQQVLENEAQTQKDLALANEAYNATLDAMRDSYDDAGQAAENQYNKLIDAYNAYLDVVADGSSSAADLEAAWHNLQVQYAVTTGVFENDADAMRMVVDNMIAAAENTDHIAIDFRDNVVAIGHSLTQLNGDHEDNMNAIAERQQWVEYLLESGYIKLQDVIDQLGKDMVSSTTIIKWVADGIVSYDEAVEVLGVSYDSLDKLVLQYRSSIIDITNINKDAADSTEDLNAKLLAQVQDLNTLQDELNEAAIKIQAFKDATASEKGDTFKDYAEIFNKASEAWEAGLVNANVVRAAAEALLDPAIYKALDGNFGMLFDNEFFKAMFAEGGEDYGANFISALFDMSEAADDANESIKELWDENGTLVASFEDLGDSVKINSIDLKALADYIGADVSVVEALADAWNIFGINISATREDLLAIVDEAGALVESDVYGTIVNMSTLVESMVNAGATADDIKGLVDQLDGLDDVTLSRPAESVDGLIEKYTKAKDGAEDAGTALEDLDDQEAVPTVDLDDKEFQQKLNNIQRHLHDLSNTVTVTRIVATLSDTASVNAAADGTDSASGGNTLVNEEGPELIVEGGRARIAGGGKPTITNVGRGAKIFTAEETADILKGKHITDIPARAIGDYGTASGTIGKKQFTGWETTATTTLDDGSGKKRTATTTVSTKSSTSTALGETTDEILTQHKNLIALLEAEYDLLESQGAPAEVLRAKAIEVQDAYYDLNEYLRTSEDYLNGDAEALKDVVDNSKSWWSWQEKIIDQLKEYSDYYNNHLDYLQSQYDLMERQSASEEDLIGKAKEVQDLLHQEAERLREIVRNANSLGLSQEDIVTLQTQINKLSADWWDWQSKIEESYDNIAKRLTDLMSSREDELQSQVDAISALQNRMVEYYETQIDGIDAQIAALKENNDALEDQITLEQKLDAIAQARQKKMLVYKGGRWQYIQDVDTVSAAVSDYESYMRQKKLDDEVAGLEKEKAALEELKDSWSDLTKEYDKKQDEWLISQQLGIDTALDGWEQLVSGAATWAERYMDIMETITDMAETQKQLLADLLDYDANIDYSAIMMQTTSYEEALQAAAKREAKIAGEGITGYASTTDILSSSWGSSGGTYYNKNVDYSLAMASASTLAEVEALAQQRNAKMKAEGITGYASSEALVEEWKKAHGYAGGTLGAIGGLSLVGEQGAELRILGRGDGIIPADMTKNLMAWGRFSPNQYAMQTANMNNSRMNVTIQALNLPNVVDGAGFVDYVKNNMFGQVLSLVH